MLDISALNGRHPAPSVQRKTQRRTQRSFNEREKCVNTFLLNIKIIIHYHVLMYHVLIVTLYSYVGSFVYCLFYHNLCSKIETKFSENILIFDFDYFHFKISNYSIFSLVSINSNLKILIRI